MRRKPRVVLDSVMAVSAFLTTGLAAGLIYQCQEKVHLYTSEEILQEIRRVLLEKEHIRNRYLILFATPYLRGCREFYHIVRACK